MPAPEHVISATEVHVGGREKRDAAVVMFVVVPAEVRLAERAPVNVTVELLRKGRVRLHGGGSIDEPVPPAALFLRHVRARILVQVRVGVVGVPLANEDKYLRYAAETLLAKGDPTLPDEWLAAGSPPANTS
ncbi:MAG TPA: hypothetical protein VGO62_08825 [Myxococcota bacterium]